MLRCERLTVEASQRIRPGALKRRRPRGDYAERTAALCAEPVLPPGIRDERDEAVFEGLDGRMGEFVASVHSLRPDLHGRTWLVEVFYPGGQAAPKISFAAKNALMTQGLSVSDRVPVLAAVDVAVITRLEPDEAYPAACLRWATTGGLRPEDVLLAVITRDRRSTLLQAGLCDNGRWTWLP